jgi:hypothetical protein
MTRRTARILDLRRGRRDRRERARRTRFDIAYAPTSTGIPAWNVTGESGATYHVILPAWPRRDGARCGCWDFLSRGLGTCKHLEATLAYVAGHPPPTHPPAPGPPGNPRESLWETVERDRARWPIPVVLSEGEFGAALLLRRSGRVLWEPRDRDLSNPESGRPDSPEPPNQNRDGGRVTQSPPP